MSIRRYGPGKFDTVLDSYVYVVSMDGTDEELGEAETFGWYGLMYGGRDLVDAVESEVEDADDELTDAEREQLAAAQGVLLHEDEHGFVGVTYFDTKDELRKEWQAVEDDYEDFLEESEEDED
jgi:hypothetical protein